MKLTLLAGSSALALAASVTVASAAPVTFEFIGSIVDFTVPTTGLYDILAAGAQGGNDAHGGLGGLGAIIGGDLMLTAGTVLQIAVGGMGGSVDPGHGGFAGGGGGSFVAAFINIPLVIAGGGGGGRSDG